MREARRILAVDEDVEALHHLMFRLEGAGFLVEPLDEPRLLAAKALSFCPHLIVMGQSLRDSSAREALRSVHAFEQTTRIPVVMILDSLEELDVLRALWAGAVDVLPRFMDTEAAAGLHGLLDELTAQGLPEPGREHLLENLLRMYRRTRREGKLLLNPETPFEGRATFVQGVLQSAEYGSLRGLAALGEMLWIEEGAWRFDGAPWWNPDRTTPVLKLRAPARPTSPGPCPEEEASSYQPRILFVDDDEGLRMLFQAQLGAMNFEVETAADGLRGVELATARPPDLILADLDMPRLDGWGMMRRLKADCRTREIPVVVYSGRDDIREALRAARVGAHDYLPKTWRSEAVIRHVADLVAPQLAASSALQQGVEVSFDLTAFGIQWLLRQAARLGLSGALQMEDDRGLYTFRITDGEPLEAISTCGKRHTTDLGAVAALLVSHGTRCTFTPGRFKGPRRLTQSMEELLRTVTDTINRLDAQAVTRRLSSERRFVINSALFGLFERIGSERDLQVAHALLERQADPWEISRRLALPIDRVHEGLKEMLRRGVIQFAPARDAVPGHST